MNSQPLRELSVATHKLTITDGPQLKRGHFHIATGDPLPETNSKFTTES